MRDGSYGMHLLTGEELELPVFTGNGVENDFILWSKGIDIKAHLLHSLNTNVPVATFTA